MENESLFDSYYDDPEDDPDLNDDSLSADRIERQESIRAPEQSEGITEIRMNLAPTRTKIDRALDPEAKHKIKYAF